MHRWLTALFIAVLCATASFGQRLSGEQIVEKHLASIGTNVARANVRSRMAMGLSSFESKLPQRKAEGRAVIVSDFDNLMFLTSYRSEEYPHEKIGYFSSKINLPWVTAGTRSPLGAFIADHEKILSDGLFTGAISSTWGLMNVENNKSRVRAAGTKTVNGRRAHVLEYYPRGGVSAEFSIKLFIDAENFRHLRSEYYREIIPKQDDFGRLGRQAGVKQSLSEDFADFKTVEGLTLPHTYIAKYRTDSNSGVFEYIWGITVTEYRMNQELAPDFFKF